MSNYVLTMILFMLFMLLVWVFLMAVMDISEQINNGKREDMKWIEKHGR